MACCLCSLAADEVKCPACEGAILGRMQSICLMARPGRAPCLRLSGPRRPRSRLPASNIPTASCSRHTPKARARTAFQGVGALRTKMGPRHTVAPRFATWFRQPYRHAMSGTNLLLSADFPVPAASNHCRIRTPCRRDGCIVEAEEFGSMSAGAVVIDRRMA